MDNANSMPIQKISDSKKTKKWFEDCVKAGYNIAISSRNSNRKTDKELQLLYNLYDGIIDEGDLKKHFDIMGINGKMPMKFQHYPSAAPRIDVLIGESIERPFEYTIAAVNEEAVFSKYNQQVTKAGELINRLIEEGADKASMQKQLRRFVQTPFVSVEEEQMSNLVLAVEYDNDINDVKQELMKDILVAGGCIGHVEVVGYMVS